jgi:CRISPR-associated protein Csd2
MSAPTVTATDVYTDPTRRHDFVLLFDVTDGNPNGDPDAGNMPRTDPETGHGLVTDVCLKRKIRNFVQAAVDVQSPGTDPARCGIYVQEKAVLSTSRGVAYAALPKGAKPTDARAKMCEMFYDVRLFGAVMSTTVNNAGQVRGPVQLTFARSADPVSPVDVSITRMAVETEREAADQGGDNRTMGRKALLPYGLYRAQGFFSPAFARQTGVTADDLSLLWQALQMMWDLDHSAARGMMSCRGLYVFTHESPLGNAPAHKLFQNVQVERKPGIETPRRFEDYTVQVNGAVPNGIMFTPLVEG